MSVIGARASIKKTFLKMYNTLETFYKAFGIESCLVIDKWFKILAISGAKKRINIPFNWNNFTLEIHLKRLWNKADWSSAII